jgi:hypothetical protein
MSWVPFLADHRITGTDFFCLDLAILILFVCGNYIRSRSDGGLVNHKPVIISRFLRGRHALTDRLLNLSGH